MKRLGDSKFKLIRVMNFSKFMMFVISLYINFSSCNVLAEEIPFWRFEPDVYSFIQDETLQLTAVLCNDSSATNDLNASTVANGTGVNWLPEQNLYQAGLKIEFADLAQQLNSVILQPGYCHTFLWGTVSAWKVVSYGQYTIDYASINGHNSFTSIIADNIFSIDVIHAPEPISPGVLHLLLNKQKI